MGGVCKKLDDLLDRVAPDSVFVEIGSDRYEGSTQDLDALAALHRTRLISVDIVPDAKRRLETRLANTDFVVADGTAWAETYQGPPVACLYLDNFDYIYDVTAIDAGIQAQKRRYSEMGLEMHNQNSQVNHMKQMLAMYPHLAPEALVAFDDTYTHNDCWIGKCGAAVVFLLTQGWHIKTITSDCGVIMGRDCSGEN